MWFDAGNRLLTATLELPGMRRENLRVRLATCPYARVKQLTVTGRSRPVVPEGGDAYVLRERKYGEFTRTIIVVRRMSVLC
jgi:HSP20 family molecular chaperone IbpA